VQWKTAISWVLAVAASGGVQATQPFPVINLHTGPGPDWSSIPAEMVQLGAMVLFVADDGMQGRELWRTDGSAANTQLVKDIHPGAQGSNPIGLRVMDELVCFTADDGSHGRELWCSDGSEAGTRLVQDILPGPQGSNPAELTVVGSTLFFRADDGIHGSELWRSDGSDAGTVMVTDLRSGAAGSFPEDLVNLNGVLLFAATRDDVGLELFRSTGSAGSTTLVRDIRPGSLGSLPRGLTVHDGLVYFRANDGTSGSELWRSDGSFNGTQLVRDLNPGSASSSPVDLVSSAAGLLFLATGSGGFGLHRSDGSHAGTFALVPAGSTRLSAGVASVGNLALFSGPDERLWRTNGTVVGTEQVIVTNQDFEHILEMRSFDGLAYYSNIETNFGFELFRSDGTAAGTFRVGDINPGDANAGPRTLRVFGDRLLFAATRNGIGRELWQVQAGSLTPTLVANIAPDGNSSHPRLYGVLNDRLLFSAHTDAFGRELWSSDGTAVGTEVLLDAAPGSADAIRLMDSGLVTPVRLQDRLYYIASAPGFSRQLWRTDGTTAGTVAVSSLGVFGCCDNARQLAAYFSASASHVYFPVRDSDTSRHYLWRSDGSTVGTQRVHPEIEIVNFPHAPRLAAGLGNLLLFSGGLNDDFRQELYRSDGSESGTLLVREINPSSGSQPAWLTRVGNVVFFSATNNATGRELYRSDGSFGGTHLVRDIAAGSVSSHPIDLTEHAGVLYFSADDGISGRELWRSDGSEAGTFPVADIVPGPAGSMPTALHSAPTGLYFAAFRPDRGFELWRSDGSEVGTHLVADLDPGLDSGLANRFYPSLNPNASQPVTQQESERVPFAPGSPGIWPQYARAIEFVTTPDGRVLLRACTRAAGCQIWISDGSEEGTTQLTHFGPMPGGGSPGHLTVLGNHVYFAATDESGQRELWGLELPPPTDLIFRDRLEQSP
jgi:ELWxxDGT repeat protein